MCPDGNELVHLGEMSRLPCSEVWQTPLHVRHENRSTLQPASTVSLFGAVAIGIGGMVGGGIFAVLGVAAEEAGGATPLAFLIAGVVAGLTAYSYSKLSVRHPSAGGTVTFIHRVFGIDFITGSVNVVLWTGSIATTTSGKMAAATTS